MRVVVVGRGGRGVASAAAAPRLEREAGQVAGAGLLVERHRVGQRGRLLVGLGHRGLGAVLGEHLLDVVAALDRAQDLRAVGTGAVHLRLVDLLHLHAHLGERRAQRGLEVLGPGGVTVPGVGHRGEGAADVLGPLRRHPDRHLAEPVVVVPRVQVPHREPTPAQLLGHEMRREELAQVAQVDRPRGAGAGGHGEEVGRAGVPHHVVGRAGHPVGGRALVASCHRGRSWRSAVGVAQIIGGGSGNGTRTPESSPVAIPRPSMAGCTGPSPR